MELSLSTSISSKKSLMHKQLGACEAYRCCCVNIYKCIYLSICVDTESACQPSAKAEAFTLNNYPNKIIMQKLNYLLIQCYLLMTTFFFIMLSFGAILYSNRINKRLNYFASSLLCSLFIPSFLHNLFIYFI